MLTWVALLLAAYVALAATFAAFFEPFFAGRIEALGAGSYFGNLLTWSQHSYVGYATQEIANPPTGSRGRPR